MPNLPVASIAPAHFPDDIETVRTLFREYVEGLGIDISFQDVAGELAALPGRYARPDGALLIARDCERHPIGCVAVRPLSEPGTCEIKRLYVRPGARGQDLGRGLAEAAIAAARAAGHHRVRLDTLSSMRAARHLYAALGFRPTAPYYDNPIADAVYLALDL